MIIHLDALYYYTAHLKKNWQAEKTVKKIYINLSLREEN